MLSLCIELSRHLGIAGPTPFGECMGKRGDWLYLQRAPRRRMPAGRSCLISSCSPIRGQPQGQTSQTKRSCYDEFRKGGNDNASTSRGMGSHPCKRVCECASGRRPSYTQEKMDVHQKRTCTENAHLDSVEKIVFYTAKGPKNTCTENVGRTKLAGCLGKWPRARALKPRLHVH